MNIKLYSYYDHFPNHKPVANEPCVEMYNDEFVYKAPVGSCALLIEPRSIQSKAYEWMEQNWKRFKYVFTHDSRLLQICDNAKLILWGWGNANYMSFSEVPKTKNISIVSSDKELCELHKARKELAVLYDGWGIVDCYGTFNGGKFAEVEDYMKDYRYSIIIENYIDDYWFTEKILNCFANKVVPIYVGAKKIGQFFNNKSILNYDNIDGVKDCVRVLQGNYGPYWYKSRLSAIEDNYKRVKLFPAFEDWFYGKYGELLNEY